MVIRNFHIAAASAAIGLAAVIAMQWLGDDHPFVAPAAAKGAPAGGRAITAPSLDALNEALLADRLAAIGDRAKDAVLLIAAARIKQRIGEADTARKPATAAGAEMKGQGSRTDVAALVARAKDYARGRKDLIALADDVTKSRTRGRLGGISRTEHVVRGGSERAVIHTFQGGEPAGVAIRGDGDTDLDLFVYDAGGKRLCASDGDTDEEICRWRPRQTTEVRIVVKNLGGVSNAYRLWTN